MTTIENLLVKLGAISLPPELTSSSSSDDASRAFVLDDDLLARYLKTNPTEEDIEAYRADQIERFRRELAEKLPSARAAGA